MSKITLTELPVTIDVKPLASGLLELFTQEERDILRFGMLPAAKMELLTKQLREKFDSLGRHPSKVYDQSVIAETAYDKDDRMSRVEGAGDLNIVEWNLGRLVREAVHEISLELYRQGDLVV